MMKSQKTGEDSQNIEDIERNLFYCIMNPLLTKFVWSRRLDISFVLFLVFLWFDKACNDICILSWVFFLIAL